MLVCTFDLDSCTECVHCYQDKYTPNTYSSGNNLDPGPILPDLYR